MGGLAPCACAEAKRIDECAHGADTCAVIVAGGSGERFGDPRGKQFVELAGLPLVGWSILAFDEAPSVGHIVVVCARDRFGTMEDEVLAQLELHKGVSLAAGGSTRQESVFNGLMVTPDHHRFVAIHDGARPLIAVPSIERCIAAVREDPDLAGAICASRVTDTLKVADDTGVIVMTPDRSAYWSAQTPQTFRREAIIAAHEAALLGGYEGTDDASLVEHVGGLVRLVETPRDNIKVTVPEDLALAESTLAARLGIA